MRFADIPGHDDIKKRLRLMVDTGHLPHALLLEGTPGSGKFALARALAQYVHCENRHDGDSCGTCPACVKHQSFNHIDTFYTFPVVKGSSGSAATSNDYIQEFREFISEHPFMDFEQWLLALNNINAQPRIYVEEANDLSHRLNFMARSADCKIVLVWLPERFQEQTANKMLKIVEEPQSDTRFIFVSNDPKGILPTIYSRCQRIAVRRYSDREIADILCRDHQAEPDDALAAARLSDGDVNRAIRLLADAEHTSKFLELFIELMRKAYQRKIALLRAWSITVADMGREQIMAFLDYCSRMIRENFMLTAGEPGLTAMTTAESQFSSRFSPFINERNVLGLFDAFCKARTDIAGNVNSKMVTFDLAVKVILLLKR